MLKTKVVGAWVSWSICLSLISQVSELLECHVSKQCHPGNMWLSSVILSTWVWAVSSCQHVAKRCPLGNMWPSSVILATCGWVVSSCQHVSEQCHPVNMWPSGVLLATCGQAVSSWQHVAKQCHPGNTWLSRVIKQKDQAWTNAKKTKFIPSLFLIYMYKKNLALNNLQRLIRHKTQPFFLHVKSLLIFKN